MMASIYLLQKKYFSISFDSLPPPYHTTLFSLYSPPISIISNDIVNHVNP